MRYLHITSVLVFALVSTGCPVRFIGTPKEELQRMGVPIERLDDRSVRISFRGNDASLGNLFLAMALCPNHSDKHPVLRELDLSRSNVTDNDLKHLQMNAHNIQSLRVLDLSETDVSDEAVADLQAVIPDCRIIR